LISNLYTEIIAITMQNTIARLGPMPNECGDVVKETITEKNIVTFMLLGRAFEDCIRENSYENLKKFVRAYQMRKELLDTNDGNELTKKGI
jgi:hypothetical protein